ncbi:HTH-type transcriptional regulator MurR [Oxobacter pfennigii]|uniref:HTH-type transcriptional regulator MurR n=1 Tax=Oxobacter pfennigii TaxID=36849 RepID=A0A0P8W1Q1_9CLOT|nr:MurR/RpiR family transcriptional regulator [Oxobacter pfennigii]KPU42388.1 HTH-type transcriptional regulator MurR [Oxobacter pfennigii]
MNFLDLNTQIDDMTGSQKKIADFISKNHARLAYLTEKEIAEELKISPATISRFWRTIGFSNSKEFKKYLKEKMTTTPANKLEDILNKTGKGNLTEEIFHLASSYLNETLLHLDTEQFKKAVSAITGARNIYVYGSGSCECLVDLFQFRLNRLGLDIKKIAKSGHEIFESLVNIDCQDVIVIFGFVNILPEVRVLLDFAGQKICTTLLITDLLVSEMIEKSNIVLYTARGELWEFHSMVAPIALLESLIVGVSRKNEKESLCKLDELHKLRKHYEEYIPKY